MKIGIVTQSYYPVLGGVTEHVWHLGRELERRGHDVTVITGNAATPDDRGLRVLRLGVQVPLSGYGANIHLTVGWKLGRVLQRIEQRERFDLVHVQCPVDPGLPIVASCTMRTPKVGTHHSYRDSHTFADALFFLFRRVFDRAVSNVREHIAVSECAARVAHRYYPDVPITVIPNGIDTGRFSPTVEPFPRYRDGIFTVLFVGRMDPRKGAKYLFAALPFIEQRLDRYRILVVGSGWMKKYYRAHIPMSLQHRVEFAGFASPDELPRYYRSADVYCSPATGNESFGIVLLEAMASGLPIVASDIEGYRHVITDGNEGVFSIVRDPRSIADKIVMLARDRRLRDRLGSAGLTTSKQYDWHAVTDRIEAVYRRLPHTQSMAKV